MFIKIDSWIRLHLSKLLAATFAKLRYNLWSEVEKKKWYLIASANTTNIVENLNYWTL